ncbi:formate transporter FocA [Vibrio nigripulchritudo]|uniref:formate transporter FocA n=1 Tax=Vibrio nigripulchritudo TaxID=28173 RepID=UPI001909156B|nr:formate transporter FocA [Vibrio nigripulchritudo]BCL72759.1 formate transporter FocA [Vibrio nigripulchritudo]BDU34120.1 formate transporter FocA [Vibrio nigripulchritudo]
MSAPDSHLKLMNTPPEMMGEAEKYAVNKTAKSTSTTIYLAMMAGAFIGLAFLFYITVTTGSENSSWGLSRLAGGIAFSLGLILIVIGGGELFTSSVLSAIALANRQISAKKMLATWGKVYIGNFFGAMLLLALVTAAGLYQLDHGQWGLNALNIAQHKVHHTPLQAFALGVLCNLLVCLAIWLSFCATNAATKAAMLILPVAMFVSSGFEHSVANMFMVPLGMSIQTFAPAEFWTQVGTSPAQYADLNWVQFVTANLIPVTLGNIVGGAVLVGLTNWSIYSRPKLKAAQIHPITTTLTTSSLKETTMNTNVTIKELITLPAFSLSAETPTAQAIDTLIESGLQGAAVTDKNDRLVGFFSIHDVLVDLWCQDYIPPKGQKVVDLMSRDVVALDASDSLLNIAEYVCIDKNQLYPTTDMGIATSFSTLSLEERAKSMKTHKPKCYPVLEGEKYIGMVTRMDVIQALRPIYGEKKDAEKANLEIA